MPKGIPKKQLLTYKQEMFAVTYVLNGGDATNAYKEVYNVGEETTINSIYVNAHKVLHNDKVSLRVHELQMMEYSVHILTIEERKRLLSKWAKKGDGKSIDMLNKMEGIYIEKMQVEEKVIDNPNDISKAIADGLPD